MKNSLARVGLLRRRSRRVLFGAVLLSSIFASSRAGIIVDTGASAYSSGGGEALYNYNDYQYLAGAFTVTQNTTITGINGWMGTFGGGNLNIGIAQDNFGLPGGGLFSQSVFVAASTPTAWQGIGSLDWDITPGTYWVTFEPAKLGFEGFMTHEAPNPMFNYAFYNSVNHEWISQASDGLGIQVFGDPGVVEPPPPMQPAPEPSTYGLIGGAALCVLVVRKIKNSRALTKDFA